MTTPEGKIKVEVQKLLNRYGVYAFRPVQMGYGMAALDFHCVVRTQFLAMAFFIETKKPDKSPTKRQDELIDMLEEKYGAKVFVIRNMIDVSELAKWLSKVRYEPPGKSRTDGSLESE